jgi:hypothetical protein
MIRFFLYTQVLDVTTTLLGLRLGAAEASPAVRYLIALGGTPLTGLLLSKAVALLLLGVAWYYRPRVITKINYFYAALTVWNLSVLLWLTR